jgi:hypothetical protein
MNALDLVVYNFEGIASFKKNQLMPQELLPGWKKKFESLNGSLRNRKVPPQIEYLSLGMLSLRYKCTNETEYNMTIKRIGRIRSPYSDSLLAAFNAFTSRNVFEHDFSD